MAAAAPYPTMFWAAALVVACAGAEAVADDIMPEARDIADDIAPPVMEDMEPAAEDIIAGALDAMLAIADEAGATETDTPAAAQRPAAAGPISGVCIRSVIRRNEGEKAYWQGPQRRSVLVRSR
jgi:hypothetical protein